MRGDTHSTIAKCYDSLFIEFWIAFTPCYSLWWLCICSLCDFLWFSSSDFWFCCAHFSFYVEYTILTYHIYTYVLNFEVIFRRFLCIKYEFTLSTYTFSLYIYLSIPSRFICVCEWERKRASFFNIIIINSLLFCLFILSTTHTVHQNRSNKIA